MTEAVDDPVVAQAVVPTDAKARLDAWATANLTDWLPSRNRARKAIKAGTLRLDGQVVESSRFVKAGQRVTLHRGFVADRKPLVLDLQVVHEDEQLAVVVKPPGLLTNGNHFVTLERALASSLERSPAPDALPWPRPVHRLDRQTGGLVVCAKTHHAQVWLGQAFEARRVHKRYRAILGGRLEGTHEVREPVEGRDAHSTVVPLFHSRSLNVDWTTTVDLFPRTGRTHQLRRHCAHLGHPILGDVLYAGEGQTLRSKGLFLQAIAVRVEAPDGIVYDWSVDEVPKFAAQRARDARRWARWTAEHGEPQR